MSSGDDDDGWEEATGIFKAVMSSEAQNVGGSQAGSLLVGRTRSPESDSAAAERTQLFPLKNTITSQVSHWLFLPVHHLF